MLPPTTRRSFLKSTSQFAAGAALASGTAATLSAASRNRVVGANDRIRIGIIGCGDRGRTAHMKGIHAHLAATNFEIVALCDPWRVAREDANAMVKEWFGRDAQTFVSHRDLLEVKGLDAVMIASPDFHHTTHLEAAAKAGKHIYVEKPLADDLEKLKRAVDAVQAAGTTVQVGTQLRSLASVTGARELMRSGIFGKITRVDEHRNAEKPYWYSYIDRHAKAEDMDWKEFLGDRPWRPFDPIHAACWYGYDDYCLGPVPQWGVHFLDMMHYIMDCGLPESCVCHGGVFAYRDEHRFTSPDSVSASWIYPEGFMVTSSNNLSNGYGNMRKFFGEKGTLKLDSWNNPTYSAEGGPRRDGSIRGDNPVKPIERPDHFLNWLQCMRSGERPHAPIEAGYQHAIASLMATTSYATGRRTVYDAKRREIRTA